MVDFQSMLRSLFEIEAYPQNMLEFITDPTRSRGYEALLFYNMNHGTPAEEDGKFEAAMKETLESPGDGDQGIFLLHHALAAFTDWQLWREPSGMRQRGNVPFAFEQTVQIDVADTGHPITAPLEPWDIVDETYIVGDADEDSHILLTTDHPQSMKTIA